MGSRDVFHIPNMIQNHVHIQISHSRKNFPLSLCYFNGVVYFYISVLVWQKVSGVKLRRCIKDKFLLFLTSVIWQKVPGTTTRGGNEVQNHGEGISWRRCFQHVSNFFSSNSKAIFREITSKPENVAILITVFLYKFNVRVGRSHFGAL